MNAVQEEVINWLGILKQSDTGLSEEDRNLIKAMVSDLLVARAKDIENFMAKTYPKAN